MLGNVVDDDGLRLLVPERFVLQDAIQLGAKGVDIDAVVSVQDDGAPELGRDFGPVLEWLVEKVGNGQDEPPRVPDFDDDMGGADGFDDAPFLFDDHGVADAHGLRERYEDSAEEICEGFLGSESEDGARDSGGTEEAQTDGASGGELHESKGDGNHDDEDLTDATDGIEAGHEGSEAGGIFGVVLVANTDSFDGDASEAETGDHHDEDDAGDDEALELYRGGCGEAEEGQQSQEQEQGDEPVHEPAGEAGGELLALAVEFSDEAADEPEQRQLEHEANEPGEESENDEAAPLERSQPEDFVLVSPRGELLDVPR